jgi:hypothetical protein
MRRQETKNQTPKSKDLRPKIEDQFLIRLICVICGRIQSAVDADALQMRARMPANRTQDACAPCFAHYFFSSG